MYRQLSLISIFILAISSIFLFLSSPANAQEVNLISNGNLETTNTPEDKPTGWLSNSWGTNVSTFTYPVSGFNGGKASQVEISSLSSGDAKWYFQDIQVIPGQSYIFSDNYTSNVPTELVARYKMANGAFQYIYLDAVPTSTTWASFSTAFKIPDGVNSLTIFHLIEQVGKLTIDNASLILQVDTPPIEEPPVEEPPVEEPPVEEPPVEEPPVEEPPVEEPPVEEPPVEEPPVEEPPVEEPPIEEPPVEEPPVEEPPVEEPPVEEPPVEEPPVEGPTNLIINNDLENKSVDGLTPLSWLKNSWGSNTANFTFPVVGVNNSRAVKVDINSYSSGDAKWYFEDVNVNAGEKYVFSDKYKATVPTELVARYKMNNGFLSYVYISYVPASTNWNTISATFTVPEDVVSMTMFHLIAQVGSLVIDNASLTSESTISRPPVEGSGMVTLTFDDGWLSTYQNGIPILNAAGIVSSHGVITDYTDYNGYMNKTQILDIQNQGHEITAHSRTHPSLPSLNESQMRSEITGSYNDLISIGIENLTTFVYPYGEYNTLSKQIVEESFQAALSTNSGYNDSNSDRYQLRRQTIINTTEISEVKGWIDQANSDGSWVILMFHKVEYNGGTWSTTPDDLQEIVDYIVSSNIKSVTIKQGVDILGL